MDSATTFMTRHHFISNFSNFLLRLKKPCSIWPLLSSQPPPLPHPLHSLQPALAFVHFSLPSSVLLQGFGRYSSPFLERSFLVSFHILLTPQTQGSCSSLREALPITLSNVGHLCYSLWQMLLDLHCSFQNLSWFYLFACLLLSLLSPSQHSVGR